MRTSYLILLYFTFFLPVSLYAQVANDDVLTNEDTQLVFSVTNNDTDPDGIDVATVDLDTGTPGRQIMVDVASGNFLVDNLGNVTFTPATNFNGVVSRQYGVNNSLGNLAGVATINVTVVSVNDPPVAGNDAATTPENVPVDIAITANDSDVDGTLSLASIDLDQLLPGTQSTLITAQGSWSVTAGVVTFTPILNYNGVTSINYTIADDQGAVSNLASITVTVTSVNAAPVANNDAVSTNENVPTTLNLVANDTDDIAIDASTVDLNPDVAGIQTSISPTGGSVSVDNSGTISFTPTTDFNGSVIFEYTVNDNEGLTSNRATVTITVNAVNSAPVANPDDITTDEDTPTTFNILSNDNDPDGTLNAVSIDLNPGAPGRQNMLSLAGGNVSVNNSGVVSFTPALNFNGIVTFNYTVNDNEGLTSNQALVTITVTAVNDAPVAANDATSTNEGTPVTLNIVSNDTDVDGTIDATTVDLDPGLAGQQTLISPAGGSVTVNTSGVITFTPTANFNGIVTFQYTVADNGGLSSNTATVTITVNAVNNAPVANDDATTTNEDTPVTLNIVSNDTDADGTIDATTVDLNPGLAGQQTTLSLTGGTVSVNTSGVISFTPAVNFNGLVTFQYTVADNEGLVSNAATVSITVNATDDPPVANDDATATNEDTPVTLNIISNDTDADGTIDPTTVDLDPGIAGQQITLSLTGGTITVNNSGVISYTPVLNFFGTVTFQYTVADDGGLTSNAATVTITVNSVNDAPVANPDATSTNEDTPVTLNILSNDTDVDGTIDASTVDIDLSVPGIQNTRTTASGSYSVNGSGVVTFTPAANFNGSAVIQYTVNDNQGLVSNPASITINVIAVNDNPVANNDATSTNKNNPVSLNVVANDTDDGSINAATVDLDPAAPGIQSTRTVPEGTFTTNSSGSVTFSPIENYFGVVAINYTVNDNEGATSNQATITITVIHVNQKPVANPDAVSTDEDTPVSLNVLANDTDDISLNTGSVDLNVAVGGIQNTRSTAQGTFSADATGLVTFVPAANFFGTAAIQYTVNDNEGATSDPATITITVNSVNDKPVAVADTRTINEDNNAVINVVGNDTDVDGTIVPSTVDLNPSVAGIQTSLTVSEGTFSVDASGVVTFVPLNNFFGTVVISYTVNDNQGATSDPASITIIVNAVNDPPIANNDVANTQQAQAVSLNLLTNDLDVDGTINASTVDLNPATPPLDKTRVVASGTYTVDNSGVLTFTPIPTFSGTSSINYNVADNLGAKSNTATISILVNFVNMPPVANNDVVTTTEDTPVSINVLTNDTDDGTLVTSTVDLNPTVAGTQISFSSSEGTFVVNGSGLVTYTPALNFTGTAVASYTVNDNIGETSNVATLTVTVTPVNDAPVANNDAATTNEDVAVNINVIANDTDVDGTIDPATVDLLPATDEIDLTRTVPQGTFSVDASTGIVTFTPASNVFGSASISYNVRDNLGLKSNNATITVTITNVNDPPSFDVIPNQRVLRNAAAKTITISGISPGPQESEQVLISAVSANTSLIPHPTISYAGTGATATLTFKPQLNQSGMAEITVKAVDAGLNEFTRTFQIEVVNVIITSTPPTIAVVGENYEYNIETTEIVETLTLVTTQKPSWATLTSTGKNTAQLSGVTPVGATSSTVRIQLKDGSAVVDEQEYVLNINQRPSSQPFGMETNEDVSVILSSDNFILAYSDPDNHPLAEVFFTRLPRHGTLLLGSTAIALEQHITTAELGTLVYTPDENYFGLDTAYFKVRDAYSSSPAESYVHFTIAPVNDAPKITFIETEPLEYDIGRELAQIFTNNLQAEDAEGDNIVSAEIGFRRPNYNEVHDLLEFSNTAKIKGVYDAVLGVLSLTGVASVAEYQEAIRTITYKFTNLRDIILEPRTVYITLSDGNATSEPAERQIKLVFTFVELKVPQVFSPDGNGMNDLWPFPVEDGLEPYNDAKIRVFDRRGKLVFETVGFGNPWDGKVNGVYVPIGTYFFVIDLRYGNIRYNGSVTILRED